MQSVLRCLSDNSVTNIVSNDYLDGNSYCVSTWHTVYIVETSYQGQMTQKLNLTKQL